MSTDDAGTKDGPWVVVVGDLASGFDIVGPFATWAAADEWADPMMDIAGFFLLEDPSSADGETRK